MAIKFGLMAAGALSVTLGSLCLQQALTPTISQGTVSPTSSQPATIIQDNPNQGLLLTNWLVLFSGGLGLIAWGCFFQVRPFVEVNEPEPVDFSPTPFSQHNSTNIPSPLPPKNPQITPPPSLIECPVCLSENPQAQETCVACGHPFSVPEEEPEQPLYPDWDWALKGIFFNGTRTAHHFAINGATGDGKTTLTESLIRLLSEWERNPIILIIDPKYSVSQPAWTVKPICSTIEDSLRCLTQLNSLMRARVNNPNFSLASARPIFIIIDEIDWIFSEHKTQGARAVRNLIKVGRGAKFTVFLVGQTSQTQNPGLNSADLRQTTRFILGKEAIAFISNTQQNSWGSQLKPEAKNLQSQGIRFAFVVPSQGEPYLANIPNLKLNVTPENLKPAPNLEQLIAVESGRTASQDSLTQEFYDFMKKNQEPDEL